MDKGTTMASLVSMLATAGVAFDCTAHQVRVRGAAGGANEGTEGLYTVFNFDAATGQLVSVGVWGHPGESIDAA